MVFKREPQVFTANINTITVGTGATAMVLGGENVLPFYTFDAAIENRPKIGIAITDEGYINSAPGIEAFYQGATGPVESAKRAVTMPGVDFLVIALKGAHPDHGDKSPEDCAALVKEIADAVDFPIVVEGSQSLEKDAKIFALVAEAVQDKNILVLSAHEENYKAIAASVGLATGQNVGAESAVDINLAKQLNVLISQMGVKPEKIAMNLGSAAAGYGFEYVASTIDRVKAAALAQNDAMLQMPIVSPIESETWAVKESIASEEDYPHWGSIEKRAVNMEVSTAAASLAAGSNAVILRHPDAVKTIFALISGLM